MKNFTRLSLIALLGVLICSCSVIKRKEVISEPFEPLPYFAEEKVADIDGVKVVYIEAGEGPTIIFVHGLGGSISDWRENFEYFSEKYHVIILDLPGYGKSEKREDIPYGMDYFTEVIAKLMDRKNIEKATLVGNSMGGFIAANFALRHPDRLDKLVLVDANGALNMPRPLVKVFEKVSTKTWMKIINERMIDSTPKNVFYSPEFFPYDRIEETMIIYHSDEFPKWVDAMRRSAISLGNTRIKKRLGEIKTPTLIVWGFNDKLVRLDAARVFNADIPDSMLFIVKECGHMPQLEKPDVFNKAVDIFLHGLGHQEIFVSLDR